MSKETIEFCFSAYQKHYTFASIIFLLFIITVFSGNFIFMGIALLVNIIAGIIWYPHCIKCHEIVGRRKNGWYIPFPSNICPHCGQDLKKCGVEPGEIRKKRLDKVVEKDEWFKV